ncbi:amino-acid N-acetyltransferase [Marchantia polymorpha subsp. ruderalis]|uniref:amino-acid N-acetyltransferase n=2 Tax=Marchantia polymorpha TaxID=3197 RepID=A0AAF6B9E6_MARPO|nr:hypothetical protein MARPO_0138s0041 [Marchantia polymorpha]BBN08630.1 hypothetical protein Mp_4g13070 [Marchantia polymorpha subsp. ruderalis]|eukprot:PTQ29615.1 hypothetical protein MARPO_0138s0041 [Marchantia polymorpha]
MLRCSCSAVYGFDRNFAASSLNNRPRRERATILRSAGAINLASVQILSTLPSNIEDNVLFRNLVTGAAATSWTGWSQKRSQSRLSCCSSGIQREQTKRDDEVLTELAVSDDENDLSKEKENETLSKDDDKEALFVQWFRGAWPYIQGYRSSTFVLVIPGEVVADRSKIDGILQDILLLHGLGIKLVIIPGTHVQIDELLTERGHKPKYAGAYRITDAESLAASMEAAGRIRLALEAKLSRGPSIPILRRHGDTDRWHEVSVASGNFLAAKRRGVVNGVDFGATGEVKRIDTSRIKERLDSNCIVMLTNLGYSATGEVLNCNTYEVATACAVALQADKMMCLLDGPLLDDDCRLVRFMTLHEADKLIRERASESTAAADYVKAVAGQAYMQSLGLPGLNGKNGTASGIGIRTSYDIGSNPPSKNGSRATGGGFAIGGEERRSRLHGYLSELTAAVYVCRHGVRRVHILDSNVQGALLLELYTRDGIGTMVSSDSYEGTRPATYNDIYGIMELLRPLEESGVLVNRPRKQLEEEVVNYTVVERDGSIIACTALFPFKSERCGEVAAFAVAPECRGHGQGDSLLEYIEKKAIDMNLNRLFLLTTRTADWFVHRGFSECTVESLPEERRKKINFARGAKYYIKHLSADSNNLGRR